MTTSPSTCLHVITTSPKRCDHCHQQLPAEAQLAARLRGRHWTAEGSTAPLVVPNHGMTTLTLVRGDEVASMTVMVRLRTPADRPECTSDFVAEVLNAVDIGDWSWRPGDVFDVAVGVGVAAKGDEEVKTVPLGDVEVSN